METNNNMSEAVNEAISRELKIYQEGIYNMIRYSEDEFLKTDTKISSVLDITRYIAKSVLVDIRFRAAELGIDDFDAYGCTIDYGVIERISAALINKISEILRRRY